MKLKTERQILMDYMETVLEENKIECERGATWLMAKVYTNLQNGKTVYDNQTAGMSNYDWHVVPNTLKRFEEWLTKILK